MKKILMFTAALMIATQAWSSTPFYYDFKSSDPIGAEEEQLRWLYELLFAPEVVSQLPDESFKSFRVHLKDSYKIFPDPKMIRKDQLKLVTNVSGTITYAGIAKKKYIYDIIKVKDVFVLNVRVHLKNPSSTDIADFQSRLNQAASIWNANRVKADFKYEFKFQIVSDIANAHYSVNVHDTTRGPYDTNWARNWTSTVLAHEVGHMLGLGDEYQTISGKMDCYTYSLMCDSWYGQMMPHHYYFVLRRLIK